MPGPITFTIHQPMISAVGDADGRKYRLFTEKGGRRWVVADQVEAAENIYADGGPGSEGMAGRTMRFDLVDGTSVDFIGPWKVGADSLFEKTGCDVRNTYRTRGIVALNREYGSPRGGDIYTNIIHYDETPVLGSYFRVKDIAQKYADENNIPVFEAYFSKGGGCAGMVKPRPAKVQS